MKIFRNYLPITKSFFGLFLIVPLFLMTIAVPLATASPLSACQNFFSGFKFPKNTNKKTVEDVLTAIKEGNKDFRNWNLEGLDLSDLSLQGKDFRGASFGESLIMFTDLSNSDLRGAKFKDTMIEQSDFKNAIYDRYTKFPPKFDPKAHGMVLLLNIRDISVFH